MAGISRNVHTKRLYVFLFCNIPIQLQKAVNWSIHLILLYFGYNKTSSPFHKKYAVVFQVQTHKLTNVEFSMVQKIIIAKVFKIYMKTDNSL